MYYKALLSTAEMRSDGATAAIAGGVVGGLVGLVLIAVIVILIVIIVKNKQESSKHYGRSISVCVHVLYNNLLLSLQLVEELPTMTYHVRTTWRMVCVRWLNLKPTPSLLVHPDPLYKSRSMTTPCVMCRSPTHQCMKVWMTRTTNS